MKTSFLLHAFALLLLSITLNAQQGINYKAIISDDSGSPLANTPITIEFTILEEGTSNVFQEFHSPTTDDQGIIIVNIGEGTVLGGDFSAIDWGKNAHYLNIKTDTGDGIRDMGTTEFKTVPYAIHAGTVASTVDLNFINTLQKGDRVKTVGGIHGKINDVGEDYVMLEIADVTIIKVDKMAIRERTQ